MSIGLTSIRIAWTYHLRDDGDVGAEGVEVQLISGQPVVSDTAFSQYATK